MPITFNCPGCAAPMSVDDALAGRKARCPRCEQPLTIPGSDDSALGLAAAQPAAPAAEPGRCPACQAFNPPTGLLCVECGVELATGRPTGAPAGAPESGRRRQPLKSVGSGAPEEKSFGQLLGEVFYNPFEAFEAFGAYVQQSSVNLGALVGLFVVSLIVNAAGQRQLGEITSNLPVAIFKVGLNIALMVLVYDTLARFLAGHSQLVNLALAMMFLQGVFGIVSGGLAIAITGPSRIMVSWFLILWHLILFYSMLMKTYQIEFIIALAIVFGGHIIFATFVTAWVFSAF